MTSASDQGSQLQEKLRSQGLTTSSVALQGRFHWIGNEQLFKIVNNFCRNDARLQFPDASNLFMSTWSNLTCGYILSGNLTEEVLAATLLKPAYWYQSFLKASAMNCLTVTFGASCIPPSVVRRQDMQVFHAADLGPSRYAVINEQLRSKYGYCANDIAVIGMSCKAPGADDLEAFWALLCEGKSQHQEVPEERFNFKTHHRQLDTKRKWFGNFISDYDAFDHKFFKKSPRECASQDPQQRQLLQVAYQAVEHSGYFCSSKPPDHNVGCYVGVCAVDYENNVASHAPTAFTATGNLRGFIAGKVSHFFGWTGPGVTIDTACSSSAVAVHQACQAILSGECNAALAAGTHVITSPLWYQNLAGASFLSSTGACKPFDAKADGYCRGEAIAAIYLKKMDRAIADGDQILGTIAGTAVQQNDNSTPIFVPNPTSLSDLFSKVTSRASIDPYDIGVVEAHGTGTAVGDPAEYSSIRSVLAGSNRNSTVYLSSVKGLIGHSECTSGLMSLIKALLIILKEQVPPQASFSELNPGLRATSSDHITIPTALTCWKPAYKAALINNYGASGSNASIVVTQAPSYGPLSMESRHLIYIKHKVPFFFAGLDDQSLCRQAIAMLRFLQSREGQDATLSDISFSQSRRSNRLLDRRMIFSTNSRTDLEHRLLAMKNSTSSISSTAKGPQRTLILCFGGQISAFIGLDRAVYENASILRQYLGQCDAACHAQQLPSIFPDIFKKEPIEDLVKLQITLFAMQYSCAKAWIACGAEPTALIGHSFGELTALAISGVLDLSDAIKMVAGRAKVVRDRWGPERGAMIALDGDLKAISTLLTNCNSMIDNEMPAVIGCFNGPKSFTISGSERVVRIIDEALTKSPTHQVKHKKLQVTNAFHSPFIEPLLSLLEESAKDLEFKQPCIQLEHSTRDPFVDPYGARFVADHMRNAVHFNDAVQRLHSQHPSSIWLEAGSASSITNMAFRALGSPKESSFQSINITNDSGLNGLCEATTNLWQAGLNVTFWPHYGSQLSVHKPLLLPPYQFEKSRHWLELKDPVRQGAIVDEPDPKESVAPPETILIFMFYKDDKKKAIFRINTESEEYKNLLEGHIIARAAAICPATVQLDLAVEALRMIRPELISGEYLPQILNVVNRAPLCHDASRTTTLELLRSKTDPYCWTFDITSGASEQDQKCTSHTTGEILMKHHRDQGLRSEFAQHARLSTHKRCISLLSSDTAEDLIRGRNIYSAFASVVDYGQDYQGLKKLVGHESFSAGHVVKKYNDKTWFDPHLSDCFAQVGGIWVNCMTNHDPSDIYVANGIEKWVRSPDLIADNRPGSWDVAAYHSGPSGKVYTTDIFVFNAKNGVLVEMILGVQYVQVSRSSMTKLLLRLTKHESNQSLSKVNSSGDMYSEPEWKKARPESKPEKQIRLAEECFPDYKLPNTSNTSQSRFETNFSGKVKTILADLSGIEVSDIKETDCLANLGIDSLVGMELAKEIETTFRCTLPNDEVMLITDVSNLLRCIEEALRKKDEYDSSADSVLTDSQSDDETYQLPSTGATTPIGKFASLSATDNSDVKSLVAELLGVEIDQISDGVPLRDLGLDSLLSMELRADLGAKYHTIIDEHTAIEDLDIQGINKLCSLESPIATHKVKLEASALKHAQGSSAIANMHDRPVGAALVIPTQTIVDAFRSVKLRSDDMIQRYNLHRYAQETLHDQTRLCVLLAIEAFEKLGCSLRVLKAGERVPVITTIREHSQFVSYIYKMVVQESEFITEVDDHFVRSSSMIPLQTSQELLKELNSKWPEQKTCNELLYYAGQHLSDVLTGRTDGVKLIFGASRGRELVSKVYGDWPMNKLYYKLMQEFMQELVSTLPDTGEPLKILEMGAGTGGTTKWLLPILAQLNFPVQYTFTDLSPSFVAGARKQFKQYPFVKFRTHDIEAEPASDLVNTQHVVIASNAVHATKSLVKSTCNIRKLLRPNGILMMLEMTSRMYWCDMVFGLFAGWWLFDDGRTHAVTSESQWQSVLQSTGYSHVDWTDGIRDENKLEKLIIALAAETRYDANPHSPPHGLTSPTIADFSSRHAAVEEYTRRMTDHFREPSSRLGQPSTSKRCVLLTGTTGSLGSHLLVSMAEDPSVDKIICLNRHGRDSTAKARQEQSLLDKNISISTSLWAKILVLESDLSKPDLGLPAHIYLYLVRNVSHILHNSWLMNASMPIKGFEDQFRIMKRLIDLAHNIAEYRPKGFRVSFVFVSSIAVVGHYPRWKHTVHAPEERVSIEAVLENGYSDAKFVCERMLDETLHKHPDYFKASSVRIGQIAGSRKTGYWNPMEHLSFLWKSSQAVNNLPAFSGRLSWTSVDDVAGTLRDLLFVSQPYPFYHVDNPVRQSWEDMLPVLADALKIPRANLVPFNQWVDLVRRCSSKKNPAIYLIDFLDTNFIRMSCGGLLLSTTKAVEHSSTLQTVGPISQDTVLLFIDSWRSKKFLT